MNTELIEMEKKNDLEKYVNEQCSFRKNHSKMYKNIKI